MVIRATELKPPRSLPEEDFDAICCTFKINDRLERLSVHLWLEEIVAEFAGLIREERLLPNRQSDRDRLDKVLKAIQKARTALEAPRGEAANFALAPAGRRLAKMIAPGWVRKRFPDLEGDDTSRRPEELMVAVLAVIEAELSSALQRFPLLPGSRGGRHPLTQRRWILINLAHVWHDVLGRTPTAGPNSHFTAFCEAVLEAMGWPTDGVEAAVPDAIAFWRNPPE